MSHWLDGALALQHVCLALIPWQPSLASPHTRCLHPCCAAAHAHSYVGEQRNPDAALAVDSLIHKLTSVVQRGFLRQVQWLCGVVCGTSYRMKQAAFTTIAVSEDYHVQAHCDEHDLPISAILWFLPRPHVAPKSTFRMPSLGAWWTPGHGSLVVLNSKEVVHGTYAGEDDLQREANKTGILGVALFSRGDFLKAYGLAATTALAVLGHFLKQRVFGKALLTKGNTEAVIQAVQPLQAVQGKVVKHK